MAELATGAVSSLLGVIRNEAQLLGGVRGDVQFIKEEMESMNSFLLHLARTAPPGGEHDEQVRTWMEQVRVLAHDCNNCIDRYLSRRNFDLQFSKGGITPYFLWAYWCLYKAYAKHCAATELRELKNRARDVGERRMRYGVEVPTEKATTSGSGDKEHDDGDDQLAVAAVTAAGDHYSAGFFKLPRTLDDYLEAKLIHWITQAEHQISREAAIIPSVAIVADKGAGDIVAHEALTVLQAEGRTNLTVLVDVPSMHFRSQPLRPKELLYYILRELEHAKSQSRVVQRVRKWTIYSEKKKVIEGIKTHIRLMKLQDKINRIQEEFEQGKNDELLLKSLKKQIKHYDENKLETEISGKSLGALLLLLQNSATASALEQDQASIEDRPTLAPWYVHIIKETARKLQGLMEKVEEEEQEDDEDEDDDEEDEDDDDEEEEDSKAKEAAADMDPIRLHPDQYADILREVFPKTSNSVHQQDQEQSQGITSTLGDNQIKEIVEKVKLEILKELLPSGTNHSKFSQHQQEDILVTVQVANPTTIVVNDPTEKSNKKQEVRELHGQDQHIQDVAIQVPKEDVGTSNSKSLPAQEQDTNLIKIAVEVDPSKKNKNKRKQTSKSDDQGQNIDAIVQETIGKMKEVKQKINEQLKIRGVTDKIKDILNNGSAVIILKIDDLMIRFTWEKTINALSQLDRKIAGVVIVTTSSNTQRAKEEYCYPLQQEPIKYSLVGFYHDNVLKLTSQNVHLIIHDILDKCKPHEYCMKIFAHALYANPKRRSEEMEKLNNTLQKVSPDSPANIAKKMLKFSYNDLPKEYKSCLLYLAIFPSEHKIRRSTLIGRWVAEGLVTTEDWIWSNSVRKAEKCFDELVKRLFVYPADIGAAGEIKSCMVENQVHDFITKIAEKQHIMEARLSHHLARHFSIYNDLRLRGSDTIDHFLAKLSKSPISLKVLDLENCKCFKGKMHFLKIICSNILLLKYLSLRGTDATQLPKEINNLQDLEVLDIRQTKVPATATRNVKLLKLKRLLAGDTYPSCTDNTSVHVPEKIENMEHMEVLFNVKPVCSKDLKDIGALWQLRKLGVVIEKKDRHLNNLLQLISNLYKSLRSLSITLCPTTRHDSSPYSRGFSVLRNANGRRLQATQPPKFLESLSINGTTEKVEAVELLKKLLDKGAEELAKVNLSNTLLKQEDLKVLTKLPKLCCLKLQNIECCKRITFNMDEYPKLKYFIFKGSKMADISFQAGETHCLEEINLSFMVDDPPHLEESQSNINPATTATANIIGVNASPKLEEHELNNNTPGVGAHPKLEEQQLNNTTNTTNATSTISIGVDSVPNLKEKELINTNNTSNTSSSSNNNIFLSMFQNSAKQIAKVTLHGTLLKQGDLQILAKKPSIRCLVLLDKSCDERQLTFNKDEFPKLNTLIVDCSNITRINFTDRSTPKLEKIVWNFTKMESLFDINNLKRLKELQFNGALVPNEVEEAIKKHKNKLEYKHNKPEIQDQTKDHAPEDNYDVRFPFCWRNKV
ncbi:unnamed protein product [Urochloa humidicola]